MRKRYRKPSHPGNVLKNMYLEPLSITITDLSKRIGVSRKAVSRIVNERKSITPEMAVRLSVFFNTTPNLWLNLQNNYDIWHVMNGEKEIEVNPIDTNGVVSPV